MRQEAQPVVQVYNIRELSVKGSSLAGHLGAKDYRARLADQVGARAKAALHNRLGLDLACGPWWRTDEEAAAVRPDDSTATEGHHCLGAAFQRRHLPGETIWSQEIILMKEFDILAMRYRQGEVPVPLWAQVMFVPVENQPGILEGVQKRPTGVG